MEKYFEELTNDIKNAYESSPTIEEAERLAAKFLHAQIQVSKELSTADMDARMRKTGLKALKASVYMEAATKTDKKPSDTFLEALVHMNGGVEKDQNELDAAEVHRESLQTYMSVFKEAHIFFRGVAKGRFE